MTLVATRARSTSQAENTPARAIWLFLGITAVLSACFYLLLIRMGLQSSNTGPLELGLMWSPGLAAIVACLVCYRSLRPLGWLPGRIGYLLLAYFLPILYCLVAYGLAWLTGLAAFTGQLPSGMIGLIISGTIGGIISALGEELGWRGFLVPHLALRMSFTRVALFSGIIWAVWHYPYILFTDIIRQQLPLWFALPVFTLLLVAVSFVFAWLRLRSGSVWPAAILHGSHNLFLLHIFSAMTRDTGHTWYYLGEYGVVTGITLAILAGVFWRLRRRLPDPL